MRIVCAWCGETQGYKCSACGQPLNLIEVDGCKVLACTTGLTAILFYNVAAMEVTHGICADCASASRAQTPLKNLTQEDRANLVAIHAATFKTEPQEPLQSDIADEQVLHHPPKRGPTGGIAEATPPIPRRGKRTVRHELRNRNLLLPTLPRAIAPRNNCGRKQLHFMPRKETHYAAVHQRASDGHRKDTCRAGRSRRPREQCEMATQTQAPVSAVPPDAAESRHRLEVLVADTVTEQMRSIRRLSATDRFAVIVILKELHRANEVMRDQEAHLRKGRKKI